MAVPRDDQLLFVLDPLRYGSLASKRRYVRELVKPTFTRASIGTAVSKSGAVRTFGVDVPRLEWYDRDGDGVLETVGILLEGSRTNGWGLSEQLSDAGWGKIACTVTADQQMAPDGTATGDTITEDGTTNVHGVWANINGLADNVNVVISAFVTRPNTNPRDWAILESKDKAGTIRRTWFDLVNGVLGTKDAGHTAVIRRVPGLFGGAVWYRCSVVCSSASGAVQPTGAVLLANADNVANYAGNGVGRLIGWGLMWEPGSLSSYIKTPTSATVTRSADQADYGISVDLASADFTLWLACRLLTVDVANVDFFPDLIELLDPADAPHLLCYRNLSKQIVWEWRQPSEGSANGNFTATSSTDLEIMLRHRASDHVLSVQLKDSVGEGDLVSGAAPTQNTFPVISKLRFKDDGHWLVRRAVLARGLFTLAEMRAA